jgi:hypothetical protein
MDLNYNSISARVYREVYHEKHMPESLCPYFWKLVFAYPLIAVLLPLVIPSWIILKFQKDDSDSIPLGPKAVMGLLFYGFILGIFTVCVFISSCLVTYYEGTAMYGYYISGGFTTLILAVTCGYLGIKYLYQQYRKKRREALYDKNGNYIPVEEKPNIIVEFVKAKYNKFCPKITWK